MHEGRLQERQLAVVALGSTVDVRTTFDEELGRVEAPVCHGEVQGLLLDGGLATPSAGDGGRVGTARRVRVEEALERSDVPEARGEEHVVDPRAGLP